MENRLVNGHVSRVERAVVDNRYFYTTRLGVGNYTSGLVLDTMAPFLHRNAGGTTFLKQQWYNIVGYVGDNSSSWDFC